jgi:hypothetical protein
VSPFVLPVISPALFFRPVWLSLGLSPLVSFVTVARWGACLCKKVFSRVTFPPRLPLLLVKTGAPRLLLIGCGGCAAAAGPHPGELVLFVGRPPRGRAAPDAWLLLTCHLHVFLPFWLMGFHGEFSLASCLVSI